jgi:hypothetical protein
MHQGITVSGLLQMQRELAKAIQESEQRTCARIDKLAEQQALANGRVGLLERAQLTLRARVNRLDLRFADGGSIFASMTKGQKAKLTGGAVLLAGALAEGVHRLVPILLSGLTGAGGR